MSRKISNKRSNPPSVSVVIPVKNGERYLHELLTALANQSVKHDVLIIDSGSSDRSLDIARGAGITVHEIPSHEFGHGRTRNLAATLTSGEIVCFLTQDATPTSNWIEQLLAGFELDVRVGVVYGPHLPRDKTSPMIARELTEFFHNKSLTGELVVQKSGNTSYISNSNAAYRRACWDDIRFRDIAYAEDQAFGKDMFELGWLKVFNPKAGVYHAHDYGLLNFMRRYFDEYRALYDATGWVEPIGFRMVIGGVKRNVVADYRWMKSKGWSWSQRVLWSFRSTLHHFGRRIFSALGARSDRLPKAIRGWISLEGRS